MAPVYSDVPSIAAYATDFFRRHSDDRPPSFVFHERENVEFVPPERLGEARRRVARLAERGLDTDFLSRVDARPVYPVFALGDYPGLVRHRDVGYLDPAQFVYSLARGASREGAVFETGTAVRELLVRDGTVRGVRTAAGEVPADAVVVAAGHRTPSLLAGHAELPVRPYRTQAAVVDLPALRAWDGDLPMGWAPERRVYFRPMGRGRLLVGGFADPVDEPAAASRTADPAFRRYVATVVADLFEDADGARLVEDWAGVDLATPDTRPIIDAPTDGPEGLLVATGFHGRGVMTAPVAGAAVRARLLGEEPPFPLEEFALDRFEAPDPDFPFRSASAGGEPES